MKGEVKIRSPYTTTWVVFDFAGQPLFGVERVKE